MHINTTATATTTSAAAITTAQAAAARVEKAAAFGRELKGLVRHVPPPTAAQGV